MTPGTPRHGISGSYSKRWEVVIDRNGGDQQVIERCWTRSGGWRARDYWATLLRAVAPADRAYVRDRR